MEYFQGTTLFQIDGKNAVTLGKFDGVHRGHQKLMQQILEKKEEGYKSVVFAIHPNTNSLLLTGQEQKSRMENMGIDAFVDCPFVPEISGMQPEDFVREILLNRLGAECVVVGTDFRFGYKRKGDTTLLEQMAKEYGFTLRVIEKEQYQGREISSTYVKEAILAADMELAAKLLGRNYAVAGKVLHGRKLGRTMGMPTVNLIPPKEKILPPEGVYVTRTWIDGIAYPGVTNIGYKPTVGADFKGVETYLFDVDMDLYGKEIETELIRMQRPEQKFASIEELGAQMHRDILGGREFFSEQKSMGH